MVSPEPKPSYQTNYGTTHPGNVLGATTFRAIPHVSMDANTNPGALVYDPSSGGWVSLGGTSLASPCFAGLIADADGMRSPKACRWMARRKLCRRCTASVATFTT